MSVCVLFNPAAGRGRAGRRLSRFLDRWRGRAELRPTERPGHAAELAERAAGEGFEIVAAAGGDGTVHEVAAGLLAAGGGAGAGPASGGPTFAVVPVGSANDYAHSLRAQFGVRELDDAGGDVVDAGTVRFTVRGESKCIPFVCNCGAGLAGRVTAESRRIRWLQGVALYGLAAWRAVRADGPAATWAVSVDGGEPVAGPTRSFHALLGRREGNFPLAPEALLDDGLFDLLRVGDVGTWEALRLLPTLARAGPPAGHPRLTTGRGRSVRIESETPLAVHADGELVCVPADGVRRLELTLHPGRLRAKVCEPG